MIMIEQDKMTQVFDELVFQIPENKFEFAFENTLNTYSLINLIFRSKTKQKHCFLDYLFKTLFFRLSFSF